MSKVDRSSLIEDDSENTDLNRQITRKLVDRENLDIEVQQLKNKMKLAFLKQKKQKKESGFSHKVIEKEIIREFSRFSSGQILKNQTETLRMQIKVKEKLKRNSVKRQETRGPLSK